MSEYNAATPKAYNPREHLIKIRTKEGLKDYYPASYRLYELTLRYPNANFSSEIVHLDVERDLVIVKCRLYIGADYDLSEKKTEALKQGRLSVLDKAETAAKARAARDFGFSTELALETDDLDDGVEVIHGQVAANGTPPADPTNPASGKLDPTIKDTLNRLYARAKKPGLCETDRGFLVYIRKVVKVPSLDVHAITVDHLNTVEQYLVVREQQAVAA